MAEVIAETQRPAGFNADRASANAEYKKYCMAMPEGETPMSFKGWLQAQQANGNYLNTTKVTKHGWKKPPQTNAAEAPAQPTIQEKPASTNTETTNTAATAKETTVAPAPFKILGMQPIVGLVVIGAAIYIGVRLLK